MKKRQNVTKTGQVAIDDEKILACLRGVGEFTALYVRTLAADPTDTIAALSLGHLTGQTQTLVVTHFRLVKKHSAELKPLLELHIAIAASWPVILEKISQGENPFLRFLPWAVDQNSDVFSDIADEELPCC